MFHAFGNNPVCYRDPDGREDKKGVDINFLPINEDVYNFANNSLIDKKIFVIAAHGNSRAIYRYPNASIERNTRGNGIAISPKELASIIRKNENFKEGMTVVLWACNTGNQSDGKDCFAQQLADALGAGCKVVAPNKYYFISENPKGVNFIGEEKNNMPDFSKPRGRMVTYIGRR